MGDTFIKRDRAKLQQHYKQVIILAYEFRFCMEWQICHNLSAVRYKFNSKWYIRPFFLLLRND